MIIRKDTASIANAVCAAAAAGASEASGIQTRWQSAGRKILRLHLFGNNKEGIH